jgi:hypothetical protein
MKHVIVIETVDEIAGGLPLKQSDQDVLERAVELLFEMENRSCYVRSSFNQSSAVAAVHEMYNAPKWDGGEAWWLLQKTLIDAREELRLIRMKDTNAVYDPTIRFRIDLAIETARKLES